MTTIIFILVMFVIYLLLSSQFNLTRFDKALFIRMTIIGTLITLKYN